MVFQVVLKAKRPNRVAVEPLGIKEFRRRPTLPHSLPCSTIGAEELNFRVRNGNGWGLFAMTTEKSGERSSALHLLTVSSLHSSQSPLEGDIANIASRSACENLKHC